LFFDRPDSGELAILVHLNISQLAHANDPREFEELVLSAASEKYPLSVHHPRKKASFVGKNFRFVLELLTIFLAGFWGM